MTTVHTEVGEAVGHRLLAIRSAPTSDLGPSWYDTAQVLKAWLRCPRLLPDDLAYLGLRSLLDAQAADGGWATAPRPYRMVPTLAAAEVLTAARLPEPWATRASAAGRAALDYLASDPESLAPDALPDTIAVEYLVPASLEALERGLPCTDPALPAVRLALDRHCDGLRALRRLRAAAAAGAPLPVPMHYSLEVLAGSAVGLSLEQHVRDGSLACSPAATAAAAACSDRPLPAAVAYLTAEGRRLGGAWPSVAPVTVFEAAHLVGVAARAGIRPSVAAAKRIAPWLAAQLGPDGCGAGPALASDSDDTAIVLFALQALGRRVDVHVLAGYERPGHFATFPGERTVSSSTNAHVLEVLCNARDAGARDAFVERGISIAASFLLDMQTPDGHWDDKWHASPYYATASAVAALTRAGHPGGAAAATRAADWARATRRPDGTWGRWCGTREETAYALQILGPGAATVRLADIPGGTPLWHAKELYDPRRITSGIALVTSADCASDSKSQARAGR